MSDDIETAAAATPRTVLERHILDVNVPKSETEWWAHHEIVSLRKMLDDRHAADKKAWSAIMRATGKERGLPDNKEVIAFYVAEVERLESDLSEMSTLADARCVEKEFVEDENISLRAKLEIATGALLPFSEAAAHLDDDFRDVSDIWEHSSAMSLTGGDIRRAHAVYAELSADAPAQQTQISDEVREAMVEAEKALETFAKEADRQDTFHADDSFGVMTEVRDLRLARAALAKFRSVMK